MTKEIQIRWSDLDMNRHLRHSVYYDYGAWMRTLFMVSRGLTLDKMEELRMGPIIFREECVFRREIKGEDIVTIDVVALKAKADFSRWALQHRLVKDDGTLCATITVEGAWIDLDARKLAIPPAECQEVFSAFPKAESFELIP